MNKYIKMILIAVFAILSLIHLFASIQILSNYFYQFSPDKISIELKTTLILGLRNLFIGVISCSLLYGLWKMRKWFVYLFWIAFGYLLIDVYTFEIYPTFSKTENYISDTIGLFILFVAPVLFGLYIYKNRTAFNKHENDRAVS